MGYYLRFISTDERPIELRTLVQAMRAANPAFSITSRGILTLNSAAVADVEINTPADELFGAEIAELLEVASIYRRARNFAAVAECLNGARAIVAVQVLFNDLGDQALDALEPLWAWLSANRAGLLQADGEGFWRGSTLLLRTD